MADSALFWDLQTYDPIKDSKTSFREDPRVSFLYKRFRNYLTLEHFGGWLCLLVHSNIECIKGTTWPLVQLPNVDIENPMCSRKLLTFFQGG
jgi:hypothetical protein